MISNVRGKFKVTKIAKVDWSNTAHILTFQAQYDQSIEEDKKFAKATPSGSIEMTVDNPTAVEYLELGKQFYVDFTRAD